MRRLVQAVAAAASVALLAADAADATAQQQERKQQQPQQQTLPGGAAGAAAPGTPAPAGGTLGTQDVVGGPQVWATAAADVKAALSLVPTLSLEDGGWPAGPARVSLRGASPQQVLLLLDGHRISSGQFSLDLTDLPVPVERVERLEVLAPAASAVYGADAIGGVVNVVTRPPEATPAFALGYGIGADAGQRVAGGVQYGLAKLGLRLDGERQEGDGPRANADFTQTNFAAALNLPAAPWGVNVRWGALEREGGDPGPEALPSPGARRNDSRTQVRADFSYLPGGWGVSTGVFSRRRSLRLDDPDPPELDPAEPAAPIVVRREDRSQGFEGQLTVDASANERFTFGGDWATDRIESGDLDRDTDRWGVFAQDQWRAGGFSAVGAIRRDRHSDFGGKTTGSLSAGWEGSGVSLWGGWALGRRPPSFDDLYASERFAVGNPELRPESSTSYEAGAQTAGATGRLRFVYFRRDVDNLIHWTDADADWVLRPVNVAKARASGWEAELVYRPSPGYEIPVGYQRLTVEDAESGRRLDGSVRSLWRAALQATRGALTWSLEYAVTDRGRYLLRDDRWRYDVLNAAVAWTKTMGSLPVRFSLRVENLQGRDYQTVEGYPQRGRTWLVEARIGL